MYRIFMTFLALLVISTTSFAKTAELRVYTEVVQFQTEEGLQYLESYLIIPAHQLKGYVVDENNYRSSVIVDFRINSSDTLFHHESFHLQSGVREDSAYTDFSLIDVRRIAVEPGTYEISYEVYDKEAPTTAALTSKSYELGMKKDECAFSSIVGLSDYYRSDNNSIFEKNGITLIPYGTNFYPEQMNKMQFYFELYGTDLSGDDQFLLTYALEDEDGNPIGKLSRSKKYKSAPVVSVVGAFDISQLSSGTYYLSVSARNKQNQLLAYRSQLVYRSNPSYAPRLHIDSLVTMQTFANDYDSKTLEDHLTSLIPIADRNEHGQINSLKKEGTDEMRKKYFVGFWLKRDHKDPEAAWKAYAEKVAYSNYHYATDISRGYETDRGDIFLRYGHPDDLIVNREPGGYDYEIWHYFVLDETQTDVKFVFYNPTLIPNDYRLLHSNARGEVNDPRWKHKIYNSFSAPNGGLDIDNTEFRDHFGSGVDDF